MIGVCHISLTGHRDTADLGGRTRTASGLRPMAPVLQTAPAPAHRLTPCGQAAGPPSPPRGPVWCPRCRRTAAPSRSPMPPAPAGPSPRLGRDAYRAARSGVTLPSFCVQSSGITNSSSRSIGVGLRGGPGRGGATSRASRLDPAVGVRGCPVRTSPATPSCSSRGPASTASPSEPLCPAGTCRWNWTAAICGSCPAPGLSWSARRRPTATRRPPGQAAGSAGCTGRSPPVPRPGRGWPTCQGEGRAVLGARAGSGLAG